MATLLRRAAQCNNAKAVHQLLAVNVDPNATPPNCDGENALHTAAHNGCNDVVRLLLQHGGVDINARETSYNMTAAHTSILIAGLGACAFFLLPSNKTVASRGRGEENPLYTLSLLVVYGINKQLQDSTGLSVAEIDACHSWMSLVALFRLHADARYVLKHRTVVDPDLETYKQYAAARATAQGDLPTYNLMRDIGAGWRPRTHWLFHARVRDAVQTVLAVANRARETSFELPLEMWLLVMHFFQRRWWP